MNRAFATIVASMALLLTLAQANLSAETVAAPSAVNFQGRLTKPDGTPVPDGNDTVTLSLWNQAASGGTKRWEQTSVVVVRNGVFAVALNYASGFVNGFNLNTTFNGPVFLEIAMDGGSPLTPRQPLVSVPYALRANSVADGSITGASIANGSITANKLAPDAFQSLGWLLGGNAGVTSGFLGTTDSNPLVFKVNSRQAMRYSDADNGFVRSMNILGGSELNRIASGIIGATIAGGGIDSISGTDRPNAVNGDFGTVSGGAHNTAGGAYSTVAGGFFNTASGGTATVGGGSDNTASGSIAPTIGGGDDNIASHNYATVSGGFSNIASNEFNTVGGGYRNTAEGYMATIGGGSSNIARGNFSTVGGGSSNRAVSYYATVPGGQNNVAAGYSSLAAGNYANALHDFSFVWSDYAGFSSTGTNQFLIRASGGVGIGTNAPVGALHIKGFQGALNLEGTSNHVYMQFFPRGVAAGRKAYLGIPSAGSRDFEIANEDTGVLRVRGSFVNSSDIRWKTNISPIDNALDGLLSLRGVSYDWNPQVEGAPTSTERQVGLIAQEVEKVFPNLVHTDEKGYKSVNYLGAVPVLVEAVKTLKKENDDLKARLDALSKAVLELQNQRK